MSKRDEAIEQKRHRGKFSVTEAERQTRWSMAVRVITEGGGPRQVAESLRISIRSAQRMMSDTCEEGKLFNKYLSEYQKTITASMDSVIRGRMLYQLPKAIQQITEILALSGDRHWHVRKDTAFGVLDRCGIKPRAEEPEQAIPPAIAKALGETAVRALQKSKPTPDPDETPVPLPTPD